MIHLNTANDMWIFFVGVWFGLTIFDFLEVFYWKKSKLGYAIRRSISLGLMVLLAKFLY
jgi:hypothetical protein